MKHMVDGEPVSASAYHGLCGIFSRVSQHLLKQARRAVCHSGEGMRCAYRLIDGRSCAVGCLITEAEYSETLERKNAGDATVLIAVSRGLGRRLCPQDLALLLALQGVHDLSLSAWGDDSGIPAWAIVGPLNRVAERFGLPLLPKPANAPAGT